MKKALFSLIALLAIVGCAQLDKSGPYKGDTVLYNADNVITSSYDILHEFVKWEYANRSSLSSQPAIREAASQIRLNASKWIDTAIVLREAYAADPSDANKTALNTGIGVLRAALGEVTKYMQEAK